MVTITERRSGRATYRFSLRGVSRHAYEQSEKLTDIEIVVTQVLQEGKRMRCAPDELSPPSSLDLESPDVEGWQFEPALACKLGFPAGGKV
jgi:hypothetical protein